MDINERMKRIDWVCSMLKAHPYLNYSKMDQTDLREAVKDKLAKLEREEKEGWDVSPYSVRFEIQRDWIAVLNRHSRTYEAEGDEARLNLVSRVIDRALVYNRKHLDEFTGCVFEIWSGKTYVGASTTKHSAKHLQRSIRAGSILRRDTDNDVYYLP